MAARSTRLASRSERGSSKLSASRSAKDRPYTAPGASATHACGPALDRQTIIAVGFHRQALIRPHQLQAVAQIVQQPLLEAPQRRLLALAAAQRIHACRVREENLRMRIPALRELEDQFVHIEPAHQALSVQGTRRTVDLRRHQGACLGLAGPRHQQALERPQNAFQRRLGAGRAAREQGEPTVFDGEHLDDTAGVPIGVLMQNIGRRQRYAPRTVARDTDGIAPDLKTIVAELAQRHLAVGPILLDLHP